MKRVSWTCTSALALLLLAACGRTNAPGDGRDAAADGSSAGGGPGTGGGLVGTGGAAGGGAGGAAGAGGSGRDAGAREGDLADGPRDAGAVGDGPVASDAAVVCPPDYPIGATVPAGDGCNVCVCQADGYFACTTYSCVADAAAVPDSALPADGPMDAAPDTVSAETAPPACSLLSTESDCEARSDCHSVFRDYADCACATPGCCARFDRCGEGGQADCKGPALCKMMEPYCEGPYVVAYVDSCYEGCVRSADCAP
ncbi:MAG: hypothetical protein JXP73_10860 [Deltaproteobacteria bacterium]|jgi:hypothetical protein|nr:hypothetical protein [Deltaproteobacteria bacterium]